MSARRWGHLSCLNLQAREDRLAQSFHKAPPPAPDDTKRLEALEVAAADCFFDRSSAQKLLDTFETADGKISAMALVRSQLASHTVSRWGVQCG